MADGLFDDLELRSVVARNRLAVSPMCQYSSGTDGLPTEWHHVHYGTRAVGGAGIVLTEAAAVSPEGRITPRDLGIWTDEQAAALSRTADFMSDQGSLPGIQLAHAGRKASTTRPADGSRPLQPADGGWETVSPSGIPYPHDETPPPTREMDRSDIEAVVADFAAAAERSVAAGFEVLEIHAAHGYLLHQFLSPVANERTDEYGGDFEGRTRLLREVADAVRDAVGESVPVFVRISATDWLEDRDAWTPDESVRLAEVLVDYGVDLIDVSTGGIHPDQAFPETGPNFQVPFAERIRTEVPEMLVGAVGRITTAAQAEAIVRNDRADLAILGRTFLRDPYFPLHAAVELDQTNRLEPPVQYRRGF
jgi:2,4-dienoyl-CoA reductase-like NADH-dependent reductase (Old Yellow Enzyme family)